MADGGPVYGVETTPEVSIKNLQTLVREGDGSNSPGPTGPAASGYGLVADIGNSMVGLSQGVPGMTTAALGIIGQAMVNHALAPYAEALSNEAVATAQANAASSVAHGLAAEADAMGIGPGVGPGEAPPEKMRLMRQPTLIQVMMVMVLNMEAWFLFCLYEGETAAPNKGNGQKILRKKLIYADRLLY